MKILQCGLLSLVLVGCSKTPSPPQPSPSPLVPMSASVTPARPTVTASAALPTSSPTVKPSHTPSPKPSPTTASIDIEETGVKKTLVCSGEDVLVGGSENHLTLRGRVGKLLVQGSTNQITVENATSVDISGVENKVIWTGREPEIHNPGNENRVEPSMAGDPAPQATPVY